MALMILAASILVLCGIAHVVAALMIRAGQRKVAKAVAHYNQRTANPNRTQL